MKDEKTYALHEIMDGKVIVKLRENGYGECVNCLEEKFINNVFMPCKHNGTCDDCYGDLKEKKCPVCRTEIEGEPVKVFDEIKNDKSVILKIWFQNKELDI